MTDVIQAVHLDASPKLGGLDGPDIPAKDRLEHLGLRSGQPCESPASNPAHAQSGQSLHQAQFGTAMETETRWAQNIRLPRSHQPIAEPTAGTGHGRKPTATSCR